MHKLSTFKKVGGDTLGIKNIEIDKSYFGKGLEAMTGADIVSAREVLVGGLERIVLYTADGGMTDKEVESLFVNARLLAVEFISFLAAPESGWAIAKKLARACNITLLFETFSGFDFAEYAELRGDETGLIFNPYEFLKTGIGAYLGVLYKNRYKGDVKILRINDGVIETAAPCIPEHGNAEVRECASTLLSRCYDGYFSICAVDGDLSAPLREAQRIFLEL